MPAEPLRDSAGVLHAPSPAARIVSLVPSITETAVRARPARRRWSAAPASASIRATAARRAKVGGTKDVKLDRLRALRRRT
jgi:hypothetical protein